MFNKRNKVVVDIGSNGNGQAETELLDGDVVLVHYASGGEGESGLSLTMRTALTGQLIVEAECVTPGWLVYPTCCQHDQNGEPVSDSRRSIALSGQEALRVEVRGAVPNSKSVFVVLTKVGLEL